MTAADAEMFRLDGMVALVTEASYVHGHVLAVEGGRLGR
jgi:hypothetical protein